MVTGFGDAVIVGVRAAGLAAEAFTTGFFDGPHAPKKNNGRRIATGGMNRFIRSFAHGVSRTVSSCQVASSKTDPQPDANVVAVVIFAAQLSVVVNIRRNARSLHCAAGLALSGRLF